MVPNPLFEMGAVLMSDIASGGGLALKNVLSANRPSDTVSEVCRQSRVLREVAEELANAFLT